MKTLCVALLTFLLCWNRANGQHRIVNGREARIDDFQYQLSLRRNSIHVCGASVLNTLWAITAAHCVAGFERSPMIFTLRMGSSLRSSGGKVITISSVHTHPAYDGETMENDVALLRTTPNSLSGDFVAPIKLPVINDIIPVAAEAIVSGWGHMSATEHVLSNALKYTTVFVVDQQKCDEDLKYQGGISDAMFCAAAGRTDACQGDSGGPIRINDTLVGIVSWGVGCADPYYPGVYTRLAYPQIRRWVKLLTRI